MKNWATHINGLEKHLPCPMQCHLNGVHISEVPKFLDKSTNMTTNAIQLTDIFNTIHPMSIPVYFPSIAEYENEEIPKIHLIAKERPWDPSTNEYSER